MKGSIVGLTNWLASLTNGLRADQVSAIANTVVAISVLIGLVAVLIMLSRLLRARLEETERQVRQAKKDALNAYLQEYRTPEMGRAVASLWNLYRLARKNPRELVRLYIKLYQKEPSHAFHFDVRRRVSAFFQQLAVFAEEDGYARDLTYRVWSKANLDLIPRVLLPLETVAIPEILTGVPSKVSKDTYFFDIAPEHLVKAMQRLYESAPGA